MRRLLARHLSTLQSRVHLSQEPLPASSTSWRTIAIFLLVFVACAAYEGAMLKRGWVPHDDGAFAQSAQRILQGEMPHRDFDELYTGGLTYLHAEAFHLWGSSFATMRWVLYGSFLLWLPAIFCIARRFAGPTAAAGLTLLAVAASVPVYSSPVPSWYNLFFATWGTAALLKFLEDRALQWLFVAGLCAGFSTLAKIAGLYFLAAAFLFLIYIEQADSQAAEAGRPTRAYSSFIALGLFIFMLGLARTIRSVQPSYLVQFILPELAILVFLLRREFTGAHVGDRERFARFARFVIPPLVGFAIPVALFAGFYAHAGALRDLLTGVFVAPARRLTFEALHPAHLRGMNLIATAGLLFVLHRATAKKIWGMWQKTALVVVCAALLIGSAYLHVLYSFAWSSTVLLVPVATLIGLWFLTRRTSQPSEARVFLLITVLALASLIQFPFAAPVYFCYVTPLLVLTITALLSTLPTRNRFALATLVLFYIAFWVFRATPGFIYNLGLRYAPNQQTAVLTIPGAGDLKVEPSQAREYQQLIATVQQHSSGEYIYAAPDSPEVYFLAGKRNPTPTLFDFFDADRPGYNQRVLDALDRDHVTVVTILLKPWFSRPLSPELIHALEVRYPYSEQIGRFQVRWSQ